MHDSPAGQQTARKAPDTARRAPTEPKPFSFAVDRRAESRARGRASVADGHGAGLSGWEGPQTRQRTAALLGGGLGGSSILDGAAPAARGAGRPISAGQLGASASAQQQRAPSAGRQRPVSAGRPQPSLTIPKSPFLRTKTRHHSVGLGQTAPSLMPRLPCTGPTLQSLREHGSRSACCSLTRRAPSLNPFAPALPARLPQPPPQREAPKTEFRARPAPAFDSFGAK